MKYTFDETVGEFKVLNVTDTRITNDKLLVQPANDQTHSSNRNEGTELGVGSQETTCNTLGQCENRPI